MIEPKAVHPQDRDARDKGATMEVSSAGIATQFAPTNSPSGPRAARSFPSPSPSSADAGEGSNESAQQAGRLHRVTGAKTN